jgi:hypothetical protein
MQLLMLIDICLATTCVILPPAPSALQAGSSDACVYTRGSVRRASGFVLTGKPAVIGACGSACDSSAVEQRPTAEAGSGSCPEVGFEDIYRKQVSRKGRAGSDLLEARFRLADRPEVNDEMSA